MKTTPYSWQAANKYPVEGKFSSTAILVKSGDGTTMALSEL